MTLGVLGAVAVSVGVPGGDGPGFPDGRSEAVRVITDEGGARLAWTRGRAPGHPFGGAERAAPVSCTLLWAHQEPFSIPRSVAFGAGGVWTGQGVNERRAQWFEVPGAGMPGLEVALANDSPARVDAPADADGAVVLDHDGVSFTLRGVRSAGRPMAWSTAFPAGYSVADAEAARVSRDGRIAAVFLTDVTAGASTLFILDGASGEILRTTDFQGAGGSADLTDDGSLCLISQSGTARLIATGTGAEVFSAPASGAGGRFKISGDGSTLVVAALDLRVYAASGGTYHLRIQFQQPGWWFGWGAAVSRDGRTVGVMSHDAAGGYLRTATRVFDVPSGTLLGVHLTEGAGAFEDAVSGAAMSDDGEVFAACSWGTQDGAHPEVMVFDRAAHLVAGVDTGGSPFALDLSSDGRFLSVGAKSVHANVFGHGGTVSLLAGPRACYADCDASGGLTASDFGCFQSRFVGGLPGADCNSDGELTAADFSCFQTGFLAGCP